MRQPLEPEMQLQDVSLRILPLKAPQLKTLHIKKKIKKPSLEQPEENAGV